MGLALLPLSANSSEYWYRICGLWSVHLPDGFIFVTEQLLGLSKWSNGSVGDVEVIGGGFFSNGWHKDDLFIFGFPLGLKMVGGTALLGAMNIVLLGASEVDLVLGGSYLHKIYQTIMTIYYHNWNIIGTGAGAGLISICIITTNT